MSKAIIKQRDFNLVSTSNFESIERVLPLLADEPGIRELQWQAGKNKLVIHYNLNETSYARIQSMMTPLLVQYGLSLKQGFRFSLMARWYEYLDGNIRDNAAAPPSACCNRPPKQH